jgi:hypothetical protein
MQWFILPHTYVPSYLSYDLCHVSIVYLFLDWFVECLWFIKVVCWYGNVLWCPLYLCAHGLNIIGFVVCVRGRGKFYRSDRNLRTRTGTLHVWE